MTDKQLSDLFAEGTAPECDSAFIIRVTTAIGRARLRMRFLVLARRAVVMLILSSSLFMAIRLIKPVLAQMLEELPQFMGVPVPMLLGVLVAWLALRTRLYNALRRFA